MHNWIYVHSFCWSSHDLTFPEKIFQEVWEEKWLLKNFWIFLKQTITWMQRTNMVTYSFEGGAYSTEYSVSKLSFKEKQR